MTKGMFAQVEAYPRPLMEWTEQLYKAAFGKYGEFRLRENGTRHRWCCRLDSLLADILHLHFYFDRSARWAYLPTIPSMPFVLSDHCCGISLRKLELCCVKKQNSKAAGTSKGASKLRHSFEEYLLRKEETLVFF